MNKVIEILMERDGMTKHEATTLVNEVRLEILSCPDEADEIMMDMLGLEPDYIFDIFD